MTEEEAIAYLKTINFVNPGQPEKVMAAMEAAKGTQMVIDAITFRLKDAIRIGEPEYIENVLQTIVALYPDENNLPIDKELIKSGIRGLLSDNKSKYAEDLLSQIVPKEILRKIVKAIQEGLKPDDQEISEITEALKNEPYFIRALHGVMDSIDESTSKSSIAALLRTIDRIYPNDADIPLDREKIRRIVKLLGA